MNEFTKEELIEIKEYCNWEPPAPGHSDFRQNIWRKLESLIDNYCEHELCRIDYDYNPLRCNKCKEIVE